ncbi:MAG: DUF4494 domain-containing protein [Bacteroidales bacterium]
MQTWYECRIRYQKIDEDGRERKVSEVYLFEAVSYTDAEARVFNFMSQITREEFTIMNIKKANYAEIFPYDEGDKWIKAKINIVTIDEEKGKEKIISNYYLTLADDIKESINRLEESLDYLLVPFVISQVGISNIMDILPIDENEIPSNLRPISEVDNQTAEDRDNSDENNE